MNHREKGADRLGELGSDCARQRSRFSAYLDGAMDGGSMRELSAHLDACDDCFAEFEAWRGVQETLGGLGPAPLPEMLEARLRDALASERERGTHLSPWRQFRAAWRTTLLPTGLRLGAGFAAALVLMGSALWFIGSAIPVQADDARLADLNPPQYLYSEVPAEPIATSDGFVAVLVDAKVDARGHVYDYDLMEGPRDPETRIRIESNLLSSVFKPATVFGVPVPGHVMMTYTAVSVRG